MPHFAPQPLTAAIILPPDAPRTEAEWTPEQERGAIAGLATILCILNEAREIASEPDIDDREAT